MDALENRINAMGEKQKSNDERMDSMKADIGKLTEFTKSVVDQVKGMQNQISGMQTSVTDLTANMERFQQSMSQQLAMTQ